MLQTEQVETLLKTQDPASTTPEIAPANFTSSSVSGIGLRPIPAADFNVTNPSVGIVNGVDAERWGFNGESPQAPMDNLNFPTDINMGMGIDDNTFTWEMIGLGLEEPLPPQETIDELYVYLPAHSRVELISSLQTSNLLRQNTSISPNDP